MNCVFLSFYLINSTLKKGNLKMLLLISDSAVLKTKMLPKSYAAITMKILWVW